MVREDLVEGAVSFLQDPSVASAPLEQRIAFLRSKNLTQDEIDASLARAGAPPVASQAVQAPLQYQSQYGQVPPQYGYQQPPPWAQAPPEVPRRDWRDWFIMATVVGGFGYAAYWTAKRYIYPLIAPPTPPQLEQDKAHVDEAFKQAFDLLEQLGKDTEELKNAEKARSDRLDAALAEVESVIGKMKEANETREMEGKRIVREMDDIRDLIPRAIEKEKGTTDTRLQELATEMRSLKTLVGNRMGQQQRPAPSFGSAVPAVPAPAQSPGVNGTSASAPSPAPVHAPETNGTAEGTVEEGNKPASVPDRSASSTPYGRMLGGGKAQIPAWQLAAKKRSDEAKKDTSTPGTAQPQDVSQSGTVSEADASS